MIFVEMWLIAAAPSMATSWCSSSRPGVVSKTIRAKLLSKGRKVSVGAARSGRNSSAYSAVQQNGACSQISPHSQRTCSGIGGRWQAPLASTIELDSLEDELQPLALGERRRGMEFARPDVALACSTEDSAICRCLDSDVRRREDFRKPEIRQLTELSATIGTAAPQRCAKPLCKRGTTDTGAGATCRAVLGRRWDNKPVQAARGELVQPNHWRRPAVTHVRCQIAGEWRPLFARSGVVASKPTEPCEPRVWRASSVREDHEVARANWRQSSGERAQRAPMSALLRKEGTPTAAAGSP
jgi:hypothetical protein